MLNFKNILPSSISNEYKGNKIALWFFYILTAITIARSLIHIFSNDGGAQSIATIPLDKYSPEAAKTIILIFSYWGISQLLMGIIFLLVCIKYRGLIPLMYIIIFTEYSLRFIIGHLKPIQLAGRAPGEIGNYILPVLAILMFLISINDTEK